MIRIRRYSVIIYALLFLVLLSTRFVNLGWGLPYPMHPDERNMVDAITKLRCDDPSSLFSGVIHNVPAFLSVTLGGSPGAQFQKVSCLNPDFFAYGQIVLYLGALLAHAVQYVTMALIGSDTMRAEFGAAPLLFSSIAIALRILSALSSVATVWVCLKLAALIHPRFSSLHHVVSLALLLIFSPVLIQLAHYGTTESILMLLYVVLVYRSVLLSRDDDHHAMRRHIPILILVLGCSIAVKVSSLVYAFVPMYVLFVRLVASVWRDLRMRRLAVPVSVVVPQYASNRILPAPRDEGRLDASVESHALMRSESMMGPARDYSRWIRAGEHMLAFGFTSAILLIGAGIVSAILSPHNIISYPQYLGSFSYERDIGIGTYVAFYTRQFLYEIPLIFHIRHVFPFVLGGGVSIFAIIGLLFAPWRKSQNFVRIAIIGFAVLTMPWYAKWTRFIAPIYPLLILSAWMGLWYTMRRIRKKVRMSAPVRHGLTALLIVWCIIPGVAFLSVFTTRDVRYVASEWIVNHVPTGSSILSETANVIDVPISDPHDTTPSPSNPSYRYVSFDFYELDAQPSLQMRYAQELKSADYIFVPSRRIFFNHTCIDVETGRFTTTRHSPEKCAYLASTYPRLTEHYAGLFSGKLGFEKVAEFTSYPRISVFGVTLFEFKDEFAEETSTVFDHPVVRIYKNKKLK